MKLLLEAMEGFIIQESEEGKGSTSTVMLPGTKGRNLHENTGHSHVNHQFITSDSRLIEAATIEFSDIYL